MSKVVHKRKLSLGQSLSASVVNAAPIDINGITPKVRWVRVTPEMAAKWLETANHNNRAVREAHVAKMAADMVAGNWRGQNGEAIRFDKEGRLVDGQHRLWASVNSGMPFDTLLVESIDAEDYSTIGIGASKGYADFLGPVGGEKNVYLLASTIRLVWQWKNSQLGISQSKTGPSIAQLQDCFRSNPNIRESVHRAAALEVKRLLTPSYAALIHYAGTMEGKPATVESFLERLGNGLGLGIDDPVYHLRKFLLGLRGMAPGHRRPGKWYVLALAIKAWNSAKVESKIKGLKFAINEEFPVL